MKPRHGVDALLRACRSQNQNLWLLSKLPVGQVNPEPLEEVIEEGSLPWATDNNKRVEKGRQVQGVHYTHLK